MKKIYISPKTYTDKYLTLDVLMQNNSGINLSGSDDPENPNPIIDGAREREEDVEPVEVTWGNLW